MKIPIHSIHLDASPAWGEGFDYHAPRFNACIFRAKCYQVDQGYDTPRPHHYYQLTPATVARLRRAQDRIANGGMK